MEVLVNKIKELIQTEKRLIKAGANSDGVHNSLLKISQEHPTAYACAKHGINPAIVESIAMM
jgi:hypothetical protein